MKSFKTQILLICLLFWGLNGMAQRIKLVEGKIPAMKDVNTEFTYNNVSVGKYDKEDDYIKAKTDEYNKKEPGSGDSWAIKWKDDREQRFQPKFDELLTKYGELSLNKNAKYTIIFNTQFMEPGFNIGITRRNAYINGEATIVETADKSKVVAKLTIEKAPGNSYWGNDFDTGARLAETYATAGKALGKFIKKEQ